MVTDREKEIAERENKARREMQMQKYVVDEAPDQMGDLLVVREAPGSKMTAQHGYTTREFWTDLDYSDEMLERLLALEEGQHVQLRTGLHPIKDEGVIEEIKTI